MFVLPTGYGQRRCLRTTLFGGSKVVFGQLLLRHQLGRDLGEGSKVEVFWMNRNQLLRVGWSCVFLGFGILKLRIFAKGFNIRLFSKHISNPVTLRPSLK